MLKYDLAIYEVLHEFITALCLENKSALSIVKNLVKEKLEQQLTGTYQKRKEVNNFSDVEMDMIYDLISKNKEENEEEEENE